jgi:hypothetical protein
VTVAALYVETGGVYFGLPDVDPWDETRDARLYTGPWPVVAHPPCARWCMLASVNEARWGTPIGEDGGCFEAALYAVETFGGVLEHPAYSLAWSHFDLPRPGRYGWTQNMMRPGWSAEVTQAAYGHLARKRTWLYYVGDEPSDLDWRDPVGSAVVGAGVNSGQSAGRGRLTKSEALSTPLSFRDALLSLARAAAGETPA